MKRLALILFAAILLCACSADTVPPAEDPVPLIMLPDKTYYDEFQLSDTLRLVVSARYPRTELEAINTHYDDALECFIQSALMFADEYREEDYAASYGGMYSIDEDYEIIRNDGIFFSVHRTVYDFFGGAHPNHRDKCDNFSAADGRRIGLDDMFAVSRDEYTLRLLTYFDDYIDSINGDTFDANAKQKIRDSFPYETFCVSGEDDAYLSFYFSPYVIAPYAVGTVIIPVPYAEIEDMLAVSLPR